MGIGIVTRQRNVCQRVQSGELWIVYVLRDLRGGMILKRIKKTRVRNYGKRSLNEKEQKLERRVKTRGNERRVKTIGNGKRRKGKKERGRRDGGDGGRSDSPRFGGS